MNREIKFRGWFQGINGTEMWVYGYLVKQTNGNWEITNGETSWTVDDVGQFTGLLDKNGKEIYEGDIVIPTKLKDVPNEVKYIQHGFYRVKIHKNTDYVNPLGNCEVEVIGNIYENKELLNQ